MRVLKNTPTYNVTPKLFFVFGLCIYIIGQILLAQGISFVRAQQPIDFAHWCLLIGVVFTIPHSVSFHKEFPSYIGGSITLMGIACIIGMCVIDFILWSFETLEERNAFIGHLSAVDVIWVPFISLGTGFFNLGLSIQSLTYFKNHKWAVVFILVGMIVLFGTFPIPHSIIYGYILFTFGFVLLFYNDKLIKQ